MHPGGEDVILCMAGADITGVFMDVGHSRDALIIMQKYFIGRLMTVED
jgi:cytochrome b involved in lipid metabolism